MSDTRSNARSHAGPDALPDTPGPRSAVARRSGPLAGTVRVPGDKSISHRALMLGALAAGTTPVRGLLEGEDVLATAAAMRALGAEVTREADGLWTVSGVGVDGLREPDNVIDLGNSGTGARLFAGLLAGRPFTTFLTGDASLRKRPMGRVVDPLTRMGARFESRSGGRLPLAVIGAERPRPIAYRLPVASAQVKSAILLCGLAGEAGAETTVIEPEPTRDHTENMLRHFGAEVAVASDENGGRVITVVGRPSLKGRAIQVPADPSSAAFPLVAGALVAGSEVRIEAVGCNPLRTGLMATLLDMGADLALENERAEGGEPIAELVIRHGPLKGVEVPAERAPSMIDEYPILMVAAALAQGRTVLRGIGELRVKESDRLQVMADGLAAAGVRVETGPDWMTIEGGNGEAPAGGVTVQSHLDHRIAMSFLVLGLVTREPIRVDDASPIATSFPDFGPLMGGLGAAIEFDGAEP